MQSLINPPKETKEVAATWIMDSWETNLALHENMESFKPSHVMKSEGVFLARVCFESQNHRTVEAGKDLQRSSSPTSPAQAESPRDGGPGPQPHSF